MIRLIIFDLDGVLVETKQLHFTALNLALEQVGKNFVINQDEHLSIYDGLPTKSKLDLLHKYKSLPREQFRIIEENKKRIFLEIIKDKIVPSQKLQDLFHKLKKDGFLLYVASNSIRQTVDLVLSSLGVIELIDFSISNEDVNNPKPHPEIYLKCFLKAGFSPKECLIAEDSPVGRRAASDSGANVFPVHNLGSVNYEEIYKKVQEVNMVNLTKNWDVDKLNVVIPMAGKGSRFLEKYNLPKPLIDVGGRPMIKLVVDNLKVSANYIFIVRKDHYMQYNLEELLNSLVSKCTIIIVDDITEGAACTVLLAENYINSDDNLFIVNSDQFIEWDSDKFYYFATNTEHDGVILTFEATDSKWSYCDVDAQRYVTKVAEKQPITNIANVGMYFWKRGSDYVKYANRMIEKKITTNNEYYVAPVYNEAIIDGKKIVCYPVDKMYGLGTVEDLDEFKKIHIS